MTVKTKALGSFEMSVTMQSDPWLTDIVAGDDFPGLCDQKKVRVDMCQILDS